MVIFSVVEADSVFSPGGTRPQFLSRTASGGKICISIKSPLSGIQQAAGNTPKTAGSPFSPLLEPTTVKKGSRLEEEDKDDQVGSVDSPEEKEASVGSTSEGPTAPVLLGTRHVSIDRKFITLSTSTQGTLRKSLSQMKEQLSVA